jgi:hypothetical protein
MCYSNTESLKYHIIPRWFPLTKSYSLHSFNKKNTVLTTSKKEEGKEGKEKI